VLWSCLLLSSLPLDVFARAQAPDDTRPFAVTTGGHYPRIVSANVAARAAGIVPDQLVSAALAMAPDVILRERDPVAESAALESFASWVTQFTPMVSLVPPDSIVAEISGSLRLFGGIPRLAARLAQGARDLGYTVRQAQAPTPAAALMFARAKNDARPASPASEGARSGHSADSMEREGTKSALGRSSFLDALRELPLAYLDVAPDVLATLAGAGITTFGQACALPRDGLARRAGAGFVALLDRARGLAADPRPPFVPPPVYRGVLALPAPVANVEALTFATNRLVHELAGWLQGRGLGVIEMSLALAHERYVGVRTGVPATVVRVALAAPAREPAHLVAVLRERLARVALPAPVEAIALASAATAPLACRNLGLLPGDEAVVTVPLTDRLRARLGEDAVTLVVTHAEHRPERASENGIRDDFSRSAGVSRSAPAKVVSDPILPPRPLWLLAEPEPLGHLLEAQPWVLQDGPERIESGWWDGVDVRRDYFVARNPRGETVWIYRDHRYGIDDGEWFLHGVFA
jgi:protein ImuB